MVKTLWDILLTRCPSCRRGKMFAHPAYRLTKLLKMHHNCPVCGQDFRQEPGFYFGAMYFSYAINIGIMVAFGVGYTVLFDPDQHWKILLAVFVPCMLFIPFTFRISRSLNLYIFGKIKKA